MAGADRAELGMTRQTQMDLAQAGVSSTGPSARTPASDHYKAARRPCCCLSIHTFTHRCMVPAPLSLRSRSPGLVYTAASLVVHNAPKLARSFLAGADAQSDAVTMHTFAKRDEEKHDAKFIVFACLIPILVLSSGLFAGLTLGYMSLDETQLHVLSISGTP